MVQQGNRKFYAFMITVVLFTAVVIYALAKADTTPTDMSSFSFQLALAYTAIYGTFAGSNVISTLKGQNNVPAQQPAPGEEKKGL